MRWVKYKLMPTFKEKFPGKIMIPCCDNAPYHHNRGVPSLSGIGKKADLIELMRNGTPGATTSNGGFTRCLSGDLPLYQVYSGIFLLSLGYCGIIEICARATRNSPLSCSSALDRNCH